MAPDPTSASGGSARPGRRTLVTVVTLVVVVGSGSLVGVQPVGVGETPPAVSVDETRDRPGAAVVGVSGTGAVTVSYETPAGETRRFGIADVDPDLFDPDGGWAVIDSGALPPPLEAVDGRPAAGVVSVGDRALVGNLTATTRQSGNVTVTVVAPASEPIEPARKSYFLAEYLAPYSLGGNRSAVTLVAAPRALPHRGAMYADGTGYVTRRGFWDGNVGSVWIHEYLHARQSFSLDTGMEWFGEASAEYLSYRIMQEQYRNVTDDDVLARLDADRTYPDSPLSAPSEWASNDVPYTRGVRLLYAVDARVRARSDGEATLVDVFRAMNARTDSVSVAAFQRIVERHTGREEPWIRSAVTATGPMDRYADSDSTVFAESG